MDTPTNQHLVLNTTENTTCHDNIRTNRIEAYHLIWNLDMGSNNPSKTERIDVRASANVKHLLQEAARASHKNVSEFLLDAGVAAAAQTLADRRLFVLDEIQWQAFEQALNQPVQAKPKLQQLLNQPGVLD
jgi:uncharacterized protein (DUF1778 family)